MRVDTSSVAAAGNDVVEFAAAAFASLLADPIAAKSSAAVAKESGVATTYDTGASLEKRTRAQPVCRHPRRKSAALRLLCSPDLRAAFHQLETSSSSSSPSRRSFSGCQ